MTATIAVLDSDPDTTELLKTVLEYGGFTVVTGNLTDFRLGREDVGEFLAKSAPDLLIYDLGIPYEQNWAFLKSMCRERAFPPRGVVVTTTNKATVESLLGVEAIEIVGKPYDLERLVDAVRHALEERGSVFPAAGETRDTDPDRRTGSDRRLLERRRSSPDLNTNETTSE